MVFILLSASQIEKLGAYLQKIQFSPRCFPGTAPEINFHRLDEVVAEVARDPDMERVVSRLATGIHAQFEKTISAGQVHALLKRVVEIPLTSTERSHLHRLREKLRRYARFVSTFGEWEKIPERIFKVMLLGVPADAPGILAGLHEKYPQLDPSSIGLEFFTHALEGQDQSLVTLQVWNVSGDPHFAEFRTQYYLGTACALFFFERRDADSLARARETYAEFKDITNLLYSPHPEDHPNLRSFQLPVALAGIGKAGDEGVDRAASEFAARTGATYHVLPRDEAGSRVPEILETLASQVITRSRPKSPGGT